MKLNFELLSKIKLFNGISEDELPLLLSYLNADVKEYDKNQIIFWEGEEASKIGIVLSGSVMLFKEDYYGNRSILATAKAAELFAESYACTGVKSLPVSAVAIKKSIVMLINFQKIRDLCIKSCGFHNIIINNLLCIMARQNLLLNQKIECTSKKTTKEKIMAYLLYEARKAGSNSFTIPFDRQTLADYLGVERSAMSAEIGKLRNEGRIEVDKKRFRILNS